jgi:hypothetical protein
MIVRRNGERVRGWATFPEMTSPDRGVAKRAPRTAISRGLE